MALLISSSRPKKRKAKQSLRLGRNDNRKVRRGTHDVDAAVERRARNEQFGMALPPREFSRRALFEDTSGNRYALAKETELLYSILRRRGTIDAIHADTMIGSVDSDPPEGVPIGRVLLYIKLPRARKIARIPRGEIQFRDTRSQQLYTGRIDTAFLRPRSKSGYVVLYDVHRFGTLTNPAQFERAKRERKAAQ